MHDPVKPTVWDCIRESWLLILVFGGLAAAVGLLFLVESRLPPPKRVVGKVAHKSFITGKWRNSRWVSVGLNDGTFVEIEVSQDDYSQCDFGDTVSFNQIGSFDEPIGDPLCTPHTSKPIAGSH